MGLITWIIFGALAGWLASMIVGRDKEQGAIGNIIAGIVGAMVGGWVMSMFNANGITGFNIPSLIVAIGGAVLVLALYNMMTSHGGSSSA